MTLRIGIYTRLSLDATGGEQTATARQERACRAYAEVRGWEVVEIFEDVDLSAYQPRVVRPAYERLLLRVAEGAIDGVLFWKLDRLVRRPSEFERFWAQCESAGAFIASVIEPIDASTDLGVALVRILVTFAQLESATLSVRIKAKQREMAESGRPPAGPAPFGFLPGMQELEPDEAELIREAARRVLHGESINAITVDWFRRGVRSRRGFAMGQDALRKTMLAPRLVGDRIYRGEVVARDCFPVVIDRATFALIGAALSGSQLSRPTTARYELTGLLRCGRCGGRMNGHNLPRGRIYKCTSRVGAGCNRVIVMAHHLERHMLQCVLSELRKREPAPPAPVPAERVAELLEAHAVALRELSRASELTSGQRGAQQAALVGALQRQTGLILLDGHTPIDSGWHEAAALESAWPTMSVEDRRAIYARHFHYIVINPSPSSTGSFRSERVRPVSWVSEAEPGEGLRRVADSWQGVPAARPKRRAPRGQTPLRNRNHRYRTDRELLAALRKWVESTDDPRMIRYDADQRSTRGAPSASTIARRFGGWRRALRRVDHVSTRVARRSFSDSELRWALQQWVDNGGDGRAATYSADATGQHDHPSLTTIVLRFGSWRAALAEIGEEAVGRRWTPDEAFEAVADWLRGHAGAGPSDYARAASGDPHLPSTATLTARVGKWRHIIERVNAANDARSPTADV